MRQVCGMVWIAIMSVAAGAAAETPSSGSGRRAGTRARALPRLDAQRAEERSAAWLQLRALYHQDRWSECYGAGLRMYQEQSGAVRDPDVLWWIARCAHEVGKLQQDSEQRRETNMEARGFYAWYLQRVVQRPPQERYYVAPAQRYVAELDAAIAHPQHDAVFADAPGAPRTLLHGPGITVTESDGEYVIADASGAGTGGDPGAAPGVVDDRTPPIPGSPDASVAVRRIAPPPAARDPKTITTCKDQPLWYDDDFDVATFVEMIALLTSDPVLRFIVVLPGAHQQMAREHLRATFEQVRTKEAFRTRYGFTIHELRDAASYERRLITRAATRNERSIIVQYRDVEVGPIEHCRALRPAVHFAEQQATPPAVAESSAPKATRTAAPADPPLRVGAAVAGVHPTPAIPASVPPPAPSPEPELDPTARVRADIIARANRGAVADAIREANTVLAVHPRDAILRAHLVMWTQYMGDCVTALAHYQTLVTTATIGFGSEGAHLAGARCAETAGDPYLRIAAYARYAEQVKFTEPEMFAVLGDAYRALAGAELDAHAPQDAADAYLRAARAYRRFLEFARLPKYHEQRERVGRLLEELEALPAGAVLRVESPEERIKRCLRSGQAKRRLVNRGGRLVSEIEMPPPHVPCE
ncbi:hypothetical protein HYV74_01020 [Candidatus Uhrbacteria bacterium]|nr:hypothetical protein [Candidatus Uhrbacteria bacterium]